MLRTGLIGFGSIAENGHLPALQSFAEIEVVAVADVSPARLDRAHQLLPDASLYSSPLELIEDANLDILDICAPPHTHAELIVASCQLGISTIISEKPFVLSEAEYALVARARRLSGNRLVSVNNWRYSELNQRVLDVLADDRIGDVVRVELRTGRPNIALGNAGWMPNWRSDPSVAGGGIILDHGWHQLYLVLGWIEQPLESVAASARTADDRHGSVEDEAVITLYFPSGEARIELAWTATGRTNEGSIEGTEGSIVILDDRILLTKGEFRQEVCFAGRLTESSYHPDWFRTMFAHAVLDSDPTEADRNFAEAGVLVSTIAAAYRSAGLGGIPCSPTTMSSTPLVDAALAK